MGNKNYRRKIILFILFLFVFLTKKSFALDINYLDNNSGFKVGTVTDKNFYWLAKYYHYNLKDYSNSGCNDCNVDVYNRVNSFVFNSGLSLLNSNIKFLIEIPIKTIHISRSYDKNMDKLYFGDIFVSPMVLSWYGKYYDTMLRFGVYLPTGHYKKNESINIGNGFYTFTFGAGGTLYFDDLKSWYLSFILDYKINTRQRGTDIKYGDVLSLEWGFGKEIFLNTSAIKGITLGIGGYNNWAATDGSPNSKANNYDEVYAAGPEVEFLLSERLDFVIYLRSIYEFKNSDDSNGLYSSIGFGFGF